MRKGLDVSHWQVPSQMNWARARELGFDFVYVRASNGLKRDECAAEHIRRARLECFDVGLYHFFHDDISPDSQAAVVMAAHYALRVGAGDLAPCVDIESWGGHLASPTWVAPAAQLLTRVEDLLGAACRYHNPTDWVAMGRPRALTRWLLWEADYSGPANLPDWSLWQHAPARFTGVYPAPIDWSEARELPRIPRTLDSLNIAALAADAARKGIAR